MKYLILTALYIGLKTIEFICFISALVLMGCLTPHLPGNETILYKLAPTLVESGEGFQLVALFFMLSFILFTVRHIWSRVAYG